jgi:ADP-heptose:LPS heptosyltransferase
VLIGTAEDQVIAHRLVLLDAHRIKDSTGKVSLAALPHFLTQLILYVGVDSGVTYLADAVVVPIVVIMGPADAKEQRPMGEFVEIIQRAEPCAPCCLVFATPYTCKVGTLACIKPITADEIGQRAINLLHRVKNQKS